MATAAHNGSAPPRPDAITPAQLRAYPPRIAQCISMILAHEAELCAYATGTMELHYHEQSVTAKHVARWVV